MFPHIAHIAGPLHIHSYGVLIALGVLTLLWFAKRDTKLTQLLPYETLINLVSLGIVSGVIGGRILFVIDNWHAIDDWTDMLAVWDGGLSILGSLLGVGVTLSWYLSQHKIDILPVLDRVVIYAPLAQAIGRLGCLCAGCCHGLPTNLPWAITFTQPDGLAPLGIALHPTQVYSALTLFGVFLFLYFFAQNYFKKPGQLTALYLMLASFERFFIGFWRGDTQPTSLAWLPQAMQRLSFSQLLALVIGLLATGWFFRRTYSRRS